MRLLFKNYRIILPQGILEGYFLEVEDELIKDIYRARSYSPGDFDSVYDGQGRYLSPGFIDIHNHGSRGQDLMEASQEVIGKLADYHLSQGVTSFLASVMSSSSQLMLEAVRNLGAYRNSPSSSRLLGIHIEGPFFNMENRGAQPREHLRQPDREFIAELLKLAQGRLRMVSLAPELEGGLDIIDFLRERKVVVALGHSSASYEKSLEAIDRGASIASHLFNGMAAFHHRRPGILGACLVDDRIYCEIIYDRFHLHDGAVELAIRAKGYDRLILVSDAMEAAGLEDGEYRLAGQRVLVENGAARLEDGSLAGSTLSLRGAVKNMVEYLGVPLYEAVKMASLNPARALGFEELGSLERGKVADMISFCDGLEIKEVYRRGMRLL